MKTTIGGDRLGSGNKQETSFKNYERSSHDLSYIWRSSMSSGTLVPFMNRLALPGDNWSIDLGCEVLTAPTVGPLFGSYKVQLDVFEVPLRLYNAKLHMNKLGIGMDMSKIFLPQIELKARNSNTYPPSYNDNEQVNPSSLIKYLGVSGLGRFKGTVNPAKRKFNAVPLLAVWDIYKNYYSNKQEEIGYYIHTNAALITNGMTPTGATMYKKNGTRVGDCLYPTEQTGLTGYQMTVSYPSGAIEPDWTSIKISLDAGTAPDTQNADQVFDSHQWFPQYRYMRLIGVKAQYNNRKMSADTRTPAVPINSSRYFFGLQSFQLANIDTMREQILQYAGSDAFTITSASLAPYNAHMELIGSGESESYSMQYSQESLPIKTYQSDLFNNWINTEWIDGAGGISELTAVDTTGNNFTIDALNIATKVYEMLNRIAVSGGTYDDWLEAVYTHERVKGVESPVYCGSLIKELAFEEVVSLAETQDATLGTKQPIGTLAGRGRLTQKDKGGKIEISVNEPSVIIGLVSITPRVDYSQGNQWDVNLKTYDDFHKPALDGIGFQDLITEQMVYSDSELDTATGAVTHKSLGKQPAWINYMTDYNRAYGDFAIPSKSMFMVLNRRYDKNADGTIKDATTYIDPTKFNNIFAVTSLDSQNFWTQISCNITARRKMSAKIIPNL